MVAIHDIDPYTASDLCYFSIHLAIASRNTPNAVAPAVDCDQEELAYNSDRKREVGAQSCQGGIW